MTSIFIYLRDDLVSATNQKQKSLVVTLQPEAVSLMICKRMIEDLLSIIKQRRIRHSGGVTWVRTTEELRPFFV